MNICGIIAEYNPFHNGHYYHLERAKALSEADYTIAVMSGNFMQRGTPAIFDKYTRTEAALRCGVSLVLELPDYCAAGSAEYFASGSVGLLDKLGVVTHLCFGSECGDITLLQKLAHIFAEEPTPYRESLRRKLKTGLSFPVSRAAALLEVYPQFSAHMSVLSSPNNILGLEYIKALIRCRSSITPLTISRTGSGYHDRELHSTISSASAIRQAFTSGMTPDALRSQVPPEAFQTYSNYLSDHAYIDMDDFSSLLHYKLLIEQDHGYTDYMDVTTELSERIRNNLYRFTGFSAFCNLLKTKELTYSRISRSLLHVLLNMKKREAQLFTDTLDYTPYARILGFRRDAAPLLHEIGRKTCVPLISKLADADKYLNQEAMSILRQDIRSNDIYNSVRAAKGNFTMPNEYSTPIIIV